MDLRQPQSVESLIDLIHSYGIDHRLWLKGPGALFQELTDHDVRFVEGVYGLTAVRSAVLVDVNYLADDFRWMEMYEDRQEITTPNGSTVMVTRKDDFTGLRETWNYLHEPELSAVYRCLLEEGGYSRVATDRLIRRNTSELVMTKPSRFYTGLWSQRRIAEWEYQPPREDINPNGNVEYDRKKKITTYFLWREKNCRRSRGDAAG